MTQDRKPPHVGPLDVTLLPRGLLQSAKDAANRMAQRDDSEVLVYLMRDAAMGGGLGLSVRFAENERPADSEIVYTAPKPAPLTPREHEFFVIYSARLGEQVAQRPEAYPWHPERSVASVARNMTRAMRTGEGHKESLAMRQTCRALGIAYTYKAIREYLNG